jgi:uncharacterized protein YhdP
VTERVCKVCGELKAIAMFSKRGSGRYRANCKACGSAASAARYASDADFREKAKTRSHVNRPNLQVMQPEAASAVRKMRAEYKRVARIRAAPGFKPTRHDAHVCAWRAWSMEQRAISLEAQRKHMAELHDAHVKEARAVIRWRARDAKPATREQRLRRRAAAREHLSNSYIVRLLTNSRKSCPKGAGIPLALIELKRVHLKLTRYLNQEDGDQE